MSKDAVGLILGENPLFSVLDKEQCRELGDSGQFRYYRRGDKFPVHGSDNALYVVLSGELVAVKDAKDGEEPIEVIRYTRGHFFEMPHLIHSLRADRIEVQQDAELLAWGRSTLDEIIVSFLHGLAFLGHLSQVQLQAIAREMFLVSYDEGEILFQQDELAGTLYIVISGQVGMSRHYVEDGVTAEDEIITYSRGQSFGERGLLMERPRAASAKTKGRASLLGLSADKVRELGRRHAEIEIGLYRNLAVRLDEQAQGFWRAARDIEKMEAVVRSTKAAALGQLVAGIAHEINTPVGAIGSDSHQLGEILAEIRENYEELPRVIARFHKGSHLQTIADETGYILEDDTRELIEKYVERQLEYIQSYYERRDMLALFDDMKEIYEELSEAAERIRSLVRSLANFARLDESELKKADVHEGLDSALVLLRHELKYQVIVEKDYDPGLPEITCYPNQLNQAFMNILLNAIQALDLDELEGGEKGLIRIETYEEDGWMVIAISDTGRGIRPEYIDRIFEPFFSTKGAAAAAGGLGLGLGLPISKKIIERHLGTIEVVSKVGEGTTFSVRLPLDRTV